MNSYRLIHSAAKDAERVVFDLDFMTEVLTENLQASSRGAVGKTARNRSADEDRSRDPLYNQLKMYSEVYRMLGWLRPGSKRLEFWTTMLGDQVAVEFADRPDLAYGLLRQSLMSITFPNPTTNNVGVTNQRPFRWLLMLTAALGGAITRHEMILGLLAVTDDRQHGAFDLAVDRIESLRHGDRSHLIDAVDIYASEARVQRNTLENYTRFTVGVLQSPDLGWGEASKLGWLYSKPKLVDAAELTSLGAADAEWLASARDVREADLARFSFDERTAFANFAFFSMLVRAGLDRHLVSDDLNAAAQGANPVLDAFQIEGPYDFVYSPIQEADDELLTAAGS